jgi:plastocyanin
MRTTQIAVSVLAAVLAVPALAGDIKGVVSFSGAPPKLAPLPTTRDQTACGTSVADESVVVAGGKLKNVVLTVKGAPAPAAGEPVRVVLDQTKCHYVPHVQAAAVGSPVDIINSDPILHNIHGYLAQATTFNLAMPLKNQKISKVLAKPGLINVKCDVHSWMHAYIVVTESPFAVSGDDGAFTIKGVPAGTYTLSAWHEKLGEKSVQVTVPAAGAATADFTFGG